MIKIDVNSTPCQRRQATRSASLAAAISLVASANGIGRPRK
jgi:hypothetical protein